MSRKRRHPGRGEAAAAGRRGPTAQRSRTRRPSRGPAVVVVLLIVVVGAGLAFSRLYPRFQQARHSAETRLARAPSHAPSHRTAPARSDTVTARIYFARVVNGQERMAPVERAVAGTAPARAALDELVNGELPEGCSRPLPRGASIRSVRVEDGVAIADFTSELVRNFQGGSDNEGVIVYAIVNTLTSLPGVKQAQILVDGKPIGSIGGHLDVSGPLGADEELVAKAE